MSKSICFNLDGKNVCCVCMLQTLKESEFPNLLLSTTMPIKTDNAKCSSCGKYFNSKKSYDAAEQIVSFTEKD